MRQLLTNTLHTGALLGEEPVDYVAGNPPWVNWEYLPASYRSEMTPLWKHYGFFALKGMRAVLPAGHLDLAAMFTYATIDNYLRHGGSLGFVITSTVFKSKGSGLGFRRFRLPSNEPLAVTLVDDLDALEVFDQAANHPATCIIQRGFETAYPVRYRVWKPESTAVIPTDWGLDNVLQAVRIVEHVASPSENGNPCSAWSTSKASLAAVIRKVQGEAKYVARMGLTTDGADGVYLVDIVQRKAGKLLIRNRPDLSKRKPPQVTVSIEPDLVYPVARGKHLHRWSVGSDYHIVVPHDEGNPQVGIGEGTMKSKYPRTFAFLRSFENELRRRGFLTKIGEGRSFYSLWKIGPYTFSPFKAAWRRMANALVAAVISTWEGRLLIPTDTITFIPCEEEEEAHYVTALLNSCLARLTVKASTGAGRGFGAPSMLKSLGLPRYDRANQVHRRLTELSVECHNLARRGEGALVAGLEKEIDSLAAMLWGITKEQAEAVKTELDHLEGQADS